MNWMTWMPIKNVLSQYDSGSSKISYRELEKNLYDFAFSKISLESGSINFDAIIKDACESLNSEEIDGFGVADIHFFFKNMELWITTTKASNRPFPYNNGNHSSYTDLLKSSLFGRLRSGKLPLDEPPPVAFSYPWYEIVEDPEPKIISYNTKESITIITEIMGKTIDPVLSILQNHYEIVEHKDDVYLIKDKYHLTRYRFNVWHDVDVTGANPDGFWFMQRNIKKEV